MNFYEDISILFFLELRNLSPAFTPKSNSNTCAEKQKCDADGKLGDGQFVDLENTRYIDISEEDCCPKYETMVISSFNLIINSIIVIIH